jgi:cyanophycin synthetase
MMLERAGYTADSVPEAGEVVYLRSTANLSTGGTATDVTDIIHPDNRAMAVRAVRAIGLDVGGVDFLSTNIAESYKTIGGGICEVNAAPGFRMHVAPSEGTPRDAAGPVIDMLFPPGTPSRVPIAAVTGTNGKTTTSAHARAHRQDGRLHAGPDHHRRRLHRRPAHGGGRHDRAGVRAHGAGRSADRFRGARNRARRPAARRHGRARGRRGRGAQRASDHLGLKGIDTLEQLAEVKRIVVEVARDCAVLNADDPTC